MATIIEGHYEWDEAKAASNLAKHGVSFKEASTAVDDANAIMMPDDSSNNEIRLRVIGMSARARLLLVVIVERRERDRIISARRAQGAEETNYAEANRNR